MVRLIQLKLAGFKSFVDPTTIQLQGQRVGIVGPNGCGKSNIMESVKWVLGESSAKEMRSENMDSVIFNGSENRKPISRASVELIFDNSLGKAPTEWSQYAEISVKRVIEREKGSTYYINNLAVRRKDVADLFLGTGLGGRGYAIIGQNTISQIIEAKPEELRNYLEEAAGVSKYKERRRETEFRLRDTRENLSRIQDVLNEIIQQIAKLESQAVIATKYNELTEKHKFHQAQVWVLKKRDASIVWKKHQSQVDKLVNELEQQTAALRKIEAEVETLRQAHIDASDEINKNQASFYEINAEVSNIENNIRNQNELLERSKKELIEIETNLTKNEEDQLKYSKDIKESDIEKISLSELYKIKEENFNALKSSIQLVEVQYLTSTEQFNQAANQFQSTQEKINLEKATIDFIHKTEEETNARITFLNNEIRNIDLTGQSELEEKENDLADKRLHVKNIESKIDENKSLTEDLEEEIDTLRQHQIEIQKELSQIEGEIKTLLQIQDDTQGNESLKSWTSQHNINTSNRLWEKLKIKTEWVTAIESALGVKLNAVLAQYETISHRPPASMVLANLNGSHPYKPKNTKLNSALDVIEISDPLLMNLLSEWLSSCYIIPKGESYKNFIGNLEQGEFLVNQQGDIFTKNSVSFYGKDASLSGILLRQERLKVLQEKFPSIDKNYKDVSKKLNEAQLQLNNYEEQVDSFNDELKEALNDFHQTEIEVEKTQQSIVYANERLNNITNEQNELKAKLTQIEIDKTTKSNLILNLENDALQLLEQKTSSEEIKKRHELEYESAKKQVNEAEIQLQESHFNLKIINNKINELINRFNVLTEDNSALNNKKDLAMASIDTQIIETLQLSLREKITIKDEREKILIASRDNLAQKEIDLRECEQKRLQTEQAVHPIRDKLEQSRLNEQESKLLFEQFQNEINESQFDEVVLSESITEKTTVKEVQELCNKLQEEINLLGPVNLAAIHELASEKERKGYLDSQVEDLTSASNTLEDAIKRIDKETRDRLIATFNEVNKNFTEFFRILFNGGQAQLELLGEEILDTGIQVTAQPPGKKNTTISQLSGGEKALTATALVFALFKLNPAPFCLMDEVDAPLDDSNTLRFADMVTEMSKNTQFLYVSHNKIAMEMAQQLIGVTMQESGVSRIVEVSLEEAEKMELAN
ncbi:MAG TPA: chromosome segregation protein SMC [Methylophilaceae bacterium]|nr:chromosome segregation protein SMC [Methylophilaceae bacterium]HCC72170.1 chromosome segregation protein SMC [Methylophilaceae bacterium]